MIAPKQLEMPFYRGRDDSMERFWLTTKIICITAVLLLSIFVISSAKRVFLTSDLLKFVEPEALEVFCARKMFNTAEQIV